MNKKLLKAYHKAEKNGTLSEILKEAGELYITNRIYGGFQGWRYDIVLYSDGEMAISSPLSQSNMLGSVYEGTAMVLATIKCHYDDDFELIESDIDSLTQEEKNKLFEELADELGIEKEDEEIKNVYDILSVYGSYVIEQKIEELFNDKYSKMIRDYVEACWDCQGYDAIVREIEDSIRQLEEDIEIQEKYM